MICLKKNSNASVTDHVSRIYIQGSRGGGLEGVEQYYRDRRVERQGRWPEALFWRLATPFQISSP